MEVVQNKALLLTVKNPHKITAVIPKSAVIEQGVGADGTGRYKVLVNFGIEEAQVLKNIGIKNVPSPILYNYKWPGMYAPFAHQRSTASFLSLHRRAYCFNEQGCVDSDTEYLSPTGWVKISEYKGGKVAQYDPDTESISMVDPDEYVKLPCDMMIEIKTKYGLDQKLSPEHRVLIHDGKAALQGRKKTETLPAFELKKRYDDYHAGVKVIPGGPRKLGTKTIAFSGAAIPTVFSTAGGSGIELPDNELRVQVAVIADGYFGSGTNLCVVRLNKERKIERLRELLQSANIEFKERFDSSETGYGFTVFSFQAPLRDKVFDKKYWVATKHQLRLIADEVQYWDSCITRGFRFSTYVKESADFVQYALTSTGRTSRLLVNTRERRGEQEIEYVVQVRHEKMLYIGGQRDNIKEVQSTDGYKYCFRVPTTYLVFRRNGCIFASGNTGKTAAIAWASDFLLQRGFIKRVLIICPLSIMDSAWKQDLFKILMHRKVDVAYGDRKQRKEIIRSDAEYVIINYDGVELVKEELIKGGFDLVVIDEANAIKTHTTKRWKAINSIITPDTWVWMATGTPASQAPVDAYGLAKMLNPSSVSPYFYSFRDSVMWKVTQFKWRPKVNAAETVNKLLQPAIRFTKEECLDLPELLFADRIVPLTPQQRKYYQQLKDQFIMTAASETVTSVNAATNMNKLLQVSAGAVYTDNGNVVEFDVSDRYTALQEIIDESSHKVLVFIPFKHTINLLEDKLKKDGYDVGVIHGGISAGKRTEIFNAFQTTTSPRVLLIQPAAASHGVTLHAANTIIWWGPVTSNEIYHQANARIHRAGQKNPCLVVRLIGSNVEKKLYKALDDMTKDMVDILWLYKGELEE